MGRSTGRIWQFANVQAVLISFNFCSSSYIFVKLNALLPEPTLREAELCLKLSRNLLQTQRLVSMGAR
ncbi:hypothetical protein [Leptospira interrogans]|uniref:hypothetical protein n=1 Tax=Leptospira interrogans TaxID=173 RepID=UPI00034ACFF9|nr:hypothetical protein [Leptospira interrogans]